VVWWCGMRGRGGWAIASVGEATRDTTELCEMPPEIIGPEYMGEDGSVGRVVGPIRPESAAGCHVPP
jgi:hypothetical protein